MNNKEALEQIKKIAQENNISLDEIKTELNQSTENITSNTDEWQTTEINITPSSAQENQVTAPEAKQPKKKTQLSVTAPKIMFTIGAVLLFVGISIALFQDFEDSQAFMFSIITLLFAFLSWSGAHYLNKTTDESTAEDDIKIGLIDSSLLLGSLFLGTSVVMWIIALDVLEGRGLILASLLFLSVYTACHILIYSLTKRLFPLTIAGLSIGGLYSSLSSLVFYGVNDPTVVTFLSVVLGFVFIAVGYVFYSKTDAKELRGPFWSLGGLIIAGSLYALTVIESPLQMLWIILYPAVIYLAFIMSIKLQIKTFLFTGSLFLVIYIISIVFRYFADGLGPAFAFIVSALAIIGSATLSLQLKKKHFVK